MNHPHHLFTALEIEEVFGKKYFYRQKVYRYAESGKLHRFQLKGKTCFMGSHVLKIFLKDLETKIEKKFPEIDLQKLRIFYDTINGKRIVIDGILDRHIAANTDDETEEDLLLKLGHVMEWLSSNEKALLTQTSDYVHETAIEEYETNPLTETLPEEVAWMKVDKGELIGVKIRSGILVSLPSIARFVGIRPDDLSEWISGTTFFESVLSVHHKQIDKPEISGLWKRGMHRAHIPFLPFENVPEFIVAFRQSGRNIFYPEKAEMLYQMSKETLELVGIAISGDKNQAAKIMDDISRKMGIKAADEIVDLFKQYETREFQVETNRRFRGKVKEVGENYPYIIGKMTFGITGKYPKRWQMLGEMRALPKSITKSGREVMRKLSPSDSVGLTFGEKQYTNEPDVEEAIVTGKQAKEFHQRLKRFGLLENGESKKLDSSTAKE